MSENGASPIVFDAAGPPRSRRFDDVYFSREGGLEEARSVFLAGCGLPERWTSRDLFVVAELGFGTGLNIVALLELWRRTRPPGGRLAIFSVEAEPLSAAEAGRALAAWPELADVASLLLERWPGRRAGFHRVELPEFGASLDLAVTDAAAALADWDGRADAWLLDGFAPAKNPAMWSPQLMRLIAERSAPGARAATYTVAGSVRRALAEAGFEVERRPGFAGKRQRIEARLPGDARSTPAAPSIAIVGAGIAGASLARALRALGAAARIFEAHEAGAGASGNPAALVTPRLDAGLGAAARLHAAAFDRAVRLYGDIEGAVLSRGVLQLEAGPRDGGRFAKIAASDLFEPGSLSPVTAAEASRALGEPVPAALRLADALVIEPGRVLNAWAADVEPGDVAQVTAAGGGWKLLDRRGVLLGEADIVCLAAGAGLPGLWGEAPIRPVRGQLSWSPGATLPVGAAWGAYAAPIGGGGVMFGATHDRDDVGTDHRAGDNARNLAALAARLPRLAARLDPSRLRGRASIRATTPDRLPLAGALASGLFVLGGFGARGFTLAPLLAEHLAARMLARPSPLPRSLAQVVDPARASLRRRSRLESPEHTV